MCTNVYNMKIHVSVQISTCKILYNRIVTVEELNKLVIVRDCYYPHPLQSIQTKTFVSLVPQVTEAVNDVCADRQSCSRTAGEKYRHSRHHRIT